MWMPPKYQPGFSSFSRLGSGNSEGGLTQLLYLQPSL
uniref:Uncharacterized protein n=1 Tax=Arundo donax TaxID=35708 RepID=A0A0A9H758_ARUDO